MFRQGWYKSGDIAIRDEEGLYYLYAAFPMTGSGKIAKKELRAPFWASQDRAIG